VIGKPPLILRSCHWFNFGIKIIVKMHSWFFFSSKNFISNHWLQTLMVELDWCSASATHFSITSKILILNSIKAMAIPNGWFQIPTVDWHASIYSFFSSQWLSKCLFYTIFYLNLNHTQLARSASGQLSTVQICVGFYMDFLHHHDTSLQARLLWCQESLFLPTRHVQCLLNPYIVYCTKIIVDIKILTSTFWRACWWWVTGHEQEE
jgi:hypothetical protein